MIYDVWRHDNERPTTGAYHRACRFTLYRSGHLSWRITRCSTTMLLNVGLCSRLFKSATVNVTVRCRRAAADNQCRLASSRHQVDLTGRIAVRHSVVDNCLWISVWLKVDSLPASLTDAPMVHARKSTSRCQPFRIFHLLHHTIWNYHSHHLLRQPLY